MKIVNKIIFTGLLAVQVAFVSLQAAGTTPISTREVEEITPSPVVQQVAGLPAVAAPAGIVSPGLEEVSAAGLPAASPGVVSPGLEGFPTSPVRRSATLSRTRTSRGLTSPDFRGVVSPASPAVASSQYR